MTDYPILSPGKKRVIVFAYVSVINYSSKQLRSYLFRQPHGRCFIVHKPKEFVSKVMPSYFRQSKLTSFQRQLNLYGFSRITAGRDRGGYYHELFLRDRLFLCQNMVSRLLSLHLSPFE